MKNYIQDTIKELTKEITIKDNRIISAPKGDFLIKAKGRNLLSKNRKI